MFWYIEKLRNKMIYLKGTIIKHSELMDGYSSVGHGRMSFRRNY
jgi:hypothetical protein